MYGQWNPEQIQVVHNTQDVADVFNDKEQNQMLIQLILKHTSQVLATNYFPYKMKYLTRLRCPRMLFFNSPSV